MNRRWRIGAVALAVGGSVLGLAYLFRSAWLPGVGQFLDVGQSPARVDYVYVLGGGTDSRPFAAAALYDAGLAGKVLLPTAQPGPEAEQGVRPVEDEVCRRVLTARGVPEKAIELLPDMVRSTRDEAAALARFVQARPGCTVAVVTHNFHTRRARLIFTRALAEHADQLHMVGIGTDHFDAGNWWQSEDGFRVYLTEYVKLVHDGCRP